MQDNTAPGETSPQPRPGTPPSIEDLLDCILRLDMQLRIAYASAASELLLGIPAAALHGTPLADHAEPQDLADLRENLSGLLAGTDRTAGLVLGIRLRHAAGHLVPCELHGKLNLDRNGQPVELVGILRDVTGREAAAQAAREADHRRFERQKMSAIAQLAGGIVGDLESLLKALDDCPETGQHPELAPLREQAAERIAQLRTLAGKLDLDLRDVDIDTLAADLAAALRPHLPPGIDLVHRKGAGGSTVWADPRHLSSVLGNLCLNARDAMPDGGVITLGTGLREAEPAAEDGPPSAAPRPWVTIEVRDTGQGLDAATRERILEPFFTTKTGGGGLSLPLAHGIIDQHGGRLEVASEPGRGSVFRVLLPARFAGTVPQAGADDPGRGTVLLVDDDPEILRYCGKILAAAGLRVVTCADGAEALAYIAGDDPVDLVVLDWTLPGLDGRRVREQLARRHPHLPLLIISGHQREDFESLGGIDQDTPWLVKPFTPAALTAAVRRLLPVSAPGS